MSMLLWGHLQIEQAYPWRRILFVYLTEKGRHLKWTWGLSSVKLLSSAWHCRAIWLYLHCNLAMSGSARKSYKRYSGTLRWMLWHSPMVLVSFQGWRQTNRLTFRRAVLHGKGVRQCNPKWMWWVQYPLCIPDQTLNSQCLQISLGQCLCWEPSPCQGLANSTGWSLLWKANSTGRVQEATTIGASLVGKSSAEPCHMLSKAVDTRFGSSPNDCHRLLSERV